jgi:uncharacterized membrane protein
MTLLRRLDVEKLPPMPAEALPRSHLIGLVMVSVLLLGLTVQHDSGVTLALTAATLAMFAACYWSAWVLLGGRRTTVFVVVGVVLGWFAEQMGSSRGWFFGRYTYTEVLGLRVGDVPIVVPLMWFGLPYVCLVLANLILWRRPVDDASTGWWRAGLSAFFAAMLITAFDLGADPYFVYVLKAWIMEKPDGGWFGETLQGFVGWMVVCFAVVLVFRVAAPPQQALPARSPVTGRAVLVPLIIYGGEMVFQAIWGYNSETRTLALFAMGIPTVAASVAAWQWWKGVA